MAYGIGLVFPEKRKAHVGRVADVHFTTLYAMLRSRAERERERIISRLCPRCHTDQGMKGGKTKVYI
jgi:hypothetical protein